MISKLDAVSCLSKDFAYRRNVTVEAVKKYTRDANEPLEDRWTIFTTSHLGTIEPSAPSFDSLRNFRNREGTVNLVMETILRDIAARSGMYTSAASFIRSLERHIGRTYAGDTLRVGGSMMLTAQYINQVKEELMSMFVSGFHFRLHAAGPQA